MKIGSGYYMFLWRWPVEIKFTYVEKEAIVRWGLWGVGRGRFTSSSGYEFFRWWQFGPVEIRRFEGK